MHPLTLLATGLYGKPLPQQNGAPLRLVVPWKYGFKGIKSIVRDHVRRERCRTPAGTTSQPDEYGFFSNVNPAVDHPRWSQKTERRIAGNASKLFAERIPTRLFNGYGEQVASHVRGHGPEEVVLNAAADSARPTPAAPAQAPRRHRRARPWCIALALTAGRDARAGRSATSWQTGSDALGADPVAEIEHRLGLWALRLLMLDPGDHAAAATDRTGRC